MSDVVDGGREEGPLGPAKAGIQLPQRRNKGLYSALATYAAGRGAKAPALDNIEACELALEERSCFIFQDIVVYQNLFSGCVKLEKTMETQLHSINSCSWKVSLSLRIIVMDVCELQSMPQENLELGIEQCPNKLLRCNHSKVAFYCNRKCQSGHWKLEIGMVGTKLIVLIQTNFQTSFKVFIVLWFQAVEGVFKCFHGRRSQVQKSKTNVALRISVDFSLLDFVVVV
jgi:hypothetical protein